MTGKPIWKVDTAADFGVVQNFFGVGSTPVIFDDLLIVQVGGSPAEAAAAGGRLNMARPNGTGVVAFDKRTGKVKYKLGDELASYSSPALAKVGGRQWCFLFCPRRAVGLRSGPGDARFSFSLAGHDPGKRQRRQPGGRRRPGLHFRNLRAGQRAAEISAGWL